MSTGLARPARLRLPARRRPNRSGAGREPDRQRRGGGGNRKHADRLDGRHRNVRIAHVRSSRHQHSRPSGSGRELFRRRVLRGDEPAPAVDRPFGRRGADRRLESFLRPVGLARRFQRTGQQRDALRHLPGRLRRRDRDSVRDRPGAGGRPKQRHRPSLPHPHRGRPDERAVGSDRPRPDGRRVLQRRICRQSVARAPLEERGRPRRGPRPELDRLGRQRRARARRVGLRRAVLEEPHGEPGVTHRNGLGLHGTSGPRLQPRRRLGRLRDDRRGRRRRAATSRRTIATSSPYRPAAGPGPRCIGTRRSSKR